MSVRLMSDVFRHVHGMPSGRRMLLLVLADFANDEGLCWPSIRSLATNADLGERHVSAELKELVKAGFLSIEEHAGKSNHYRIRIPQGVNHSSGVKRGAGVNCGSGEGVNCGSGEGVNHSSPKPSIEPPIEPPIDTHAKKRREYSPQFEAFWVEYPKGNGSKKAAGELWDRLDPDEALCDEVMSGLAEWKRSERWRKNFVMSAERWIRGRFWENPPPPDPALQPQRLSLP